MSTTRDNCYFLLKDEAEQKPKKKFFSKNRHVNSSDYHLLNTNEPPAYPKIQLMFFSYRNGQCQAVKKRDILKNENQGYYFERIQEGDIIIDRVRL